jgi:hypothetical protein
LAARAEDAPCVPDRELIVSGLGQPSDELARLAELAPGTLVPRSGILRRGGVTSRLVCGGAEPTPWDQRYVRPLADGPLLEGVSPRLLTTFQSNAPGGSNDGMLWQGRGLSTLLSGGARARWGALSAQLAPEVTWSQNASFTTVPTGGTGKLAFRNPWYGDSLDMPQRFGASPFARAGLGQSFVQVEGLGMRVAVSTESLWWGPGIRNALLLTNNAEGFPHLSLGTSRPADIWVGTLEAEVFWGELSKSGYFTSSTHPAFSGLALVYQPRWIPGLYLGGGRTFVESWASLRYHKFFSVLEAFSKQQVAGGDNPVDNQIASVWFRWVMPEIELYGEYGIDDFATLAGLVRVPDRTAAWTLGFQKRWVMGERWWRVVGELAKTRSNLPAPFDNPFYTHGQNADYTNRGQLLGDWIGPGADTQHLGVDLFTSSGRVGGYLERVRRNDEIFWRQIVSRPGTDHDAELVLGVRQVWFARTFELSWEIAGGQRWNRDFGANEPLVRASLAIRVPLGGRLTRDAAAPLD